MRFGIEIQDDRVFSPVAWALIVIGIEETIGC